MEIHCQLKFLEALLSFMLQLTKLQLEFPIKILEITQSKGLSLKKCIVQGYDGVRTMSGLYTGVQKRIEALQPKAIYVHCAANNLNLFINDAVCAVRETASFFTVLQDVYTFFAYIIRRWNLLSLFTGESEVKLKRLSPTRWAGRISSVLSVKLRFVDIIKSLSQIILLKCLQT